MTALDDIVDRWEEANESGVQLSVEELCIDHPELIEQARWEIQALLAVDGFLELKASRDVRLKRESPSTFVPPNSVELSGRYRLEHLHASGGLGQVYRAFDTTLNRPVAIKFPKRSEMTAEQLLRFEREARITGQLEHPGIVPIYAMKWGQDKAPCYVMRFIDGATLSDTVKKVLSEKQPPNGLAGLDYFASEEFRRLLQSMVSLGNIVAYAHERGFIHRDIKPANIMLGPFGETLLLDWGIAKELKPESTGLMQVSVVTPANESVESKFEFNGVSSAATCSSEYFDGPMYTSTGQLLGTPAFASPEQILGQRDDVKTSSDIFSLGSTLFFVLSGKSPIELLGWNAYLQQIASTETDLSALLPGAAPAGLRAICQKATQIDSDARYQSASEFVLDLERFLAREPISVMKEPLSSRIARLSRKRPALVGASIATIGVAFLALILASSLINTKNRELSAGNAKLSQTLADLEKTNELAIDTLRSVFDNVTETRLAAQTELTQSDRRYLDTALLQYLEFAELQHDSERTLAIRAEAHLQSGNILLELSQAPEAIYHLEKAIVLFEKLLSQHDMPDYRIDLAHGLNALGHIHLKFGRFEQALLVGKKGLALFDSSDWGAGYADSDQQLALRLIHADLCKTVGGGYEISEEFDQAIDAYEQSQRLLEDLVKTAPETQFIKKALASCYRSLSDLLGNVPSTEGIANRELIYADRAIELFNELSDRYTQDRSYQHGLSWAYYDRGHVMQRKGDLRSAIQDVGKGIKIIESLRDNFPLIDDYRASFSIMHLRRARLAVKEGSLREAAADIGCLDPGMAESEADVFFCVQTVQRLNNEFPEQLEYELLLVDVLRQQAAWHESREDYKVAEHDFSDGLDGCERILERLVENPEAETRKVLCLLDLSRIHSLLSDTGKAQSEYDTARKAASSIKAISSDDSDLLNSAFEKHDRNSQIAK